MQATLKKICSAWEVPWCGWLHFHPLQNITALNKINQMFNQGKNLSTNFIFYIQGTYILLFHVMYIHIQFFIHILSGYYIVLRFVNTFWKYWRLSFYTYNWPALYCFFSCNIIEWLWNESFMPVCVYFNVYLMQHRFESNSFEYNIRIVSRPHFYYD